MSDEEKKPTLTRKPLGLKRTVEAGKVQQQFSHGRRNTVLVEVKRRRSVAPDVPEPETPPPATPTAPTPTSPPTAPRPATETDKLMSRQEVQDNLLREAEENRIAALEESRRREAENRRATEEQREQRAPQEQSLAEDSTPEDSTSKDSTAAPSEDAPATETPLDSAATDATDAIPDSPAETVETAAPAAEIAPDIASETAANRKAAASPKRRFTSSDSEKGGAQRKSHRDGDRDRRSSVSKPRRQSGKLTVARALSEDDGARARSLAALKRAREKERRAMQEHTGPREKQKREIIVPEAIVVQELANRMAEKGADLVKSLFKMGMMVTVNQTIDQDTAELLVSEFGHEVKRVSEADVDIDYTTDVDAPETLRPRAPVVTIMGHVDHGKTSLLDALRGTAIVDGEAGGITQHIGAYQVTNKSGKAVTFLDTPGHAAFTEMRARGSNVTDIIILVVAADDGIMPQTQEAIAHARAAEVPIIVAINKIDKPEANPQKIRERLLEEEVVVEAMGGDVQDVEISAKQRTNLDKLLDALDLQAEIMELSANPDRAAEATVIEAKLDKGRGAVASLLIRRGTLHVGDIFVCGATSGRVRAIIDDQGKRIKQATPSMPVEILGLADVPMAGDRLTVVENEARAREVASYRQEQALKKRTTQVPVNLEGMFSAMADKASLVEFPLVIKGDVHGSVEAIVSALNNLSTSEIRVHVLHSGVGGITESDVTLAAATNAPIIGFNVRPNAKARAIAESEKVSLRYYDVIYQLTEEIAKEMAGELAPERIETIVGRAEIREVFPAGKHGRAAGIFVTEGAIRKALKARITRDDVIIYDGEIASLRRFKDDVAEVSSGTECGVTFASHSDIEAGDFLETYEVEERARTL